MPFSTRRRVLRALSLAAATLLAGAPLAAQEARTIDPGMSHAQVVERLGRPKGERTAGEYTYLFYANGCLKTCGIDDVVTLQNDAVVDAIFRGAGRHYSGSSSSPRALTPAAARAGGGAERAGAPPRRPTVGAITTSDSAAAAGTQRGGLVVAGQTPEDSAAAPPPRRPRGGRSARNTRRRRGASARPTVPPIRLSAEDSAAMAAGAAPARPAAPPAIIDSARTGRRTTTGPVDAGAAVKNAGGRLYPSATPVRPSSGPGADSAAGSSAGRVPFQGSKLAPADSAAAVNRRPPPAVPPKSDSTRPTPPPAGR